MQEKGKYKKEILQVLLRTEMYKEWVLRFNVGISYPVIKDSDILNILIPILDNSVQDFIVKKIQEAFRRRKKAKELIEIAIRSVEMAIEQDKKLLWSGFLQIMSYGSKRYL